VTTSPTTPRTCTSRLRRRLKGAGRALMDTYLKALRAAGVRRVHLSMSAASTGARALYDRLGFHQIARPTLTRVLLGRRTHAC
jgi:GNAT superfamily N-acetyltransferase